jgi:MoxR-like ATPase
LAEIVTRTTGHAVVEPASGVDATAVHAMTSLIREVPIADDVLRMALRMVRATHPDADEAPLNVRKYVRYGASPRAAQTLVLGAKARALLQSRYHVSRDDIRAIAAAALRHRVLLNFQAELDRVSSDALVADVLETVADH